VVVDTKLRMPLIARIVKTADDDLLIVTAASLKSLKAQKLQKLGVELIQQRARRGKVDLPGVLKELGRRDFLSVLLEAGPRLNGAALESGVVQKLVLFYAPKLAGKTDVPFILNAGERAPAMHVTAIRQFGADVAIDARLEY
jgi:diaminohydroxyphosphoribosylaminopyrimidine deaminase/5-amino-6-(5-phosphoribosylamino)uracil reductase